MTSSPPLCYGALLLANLLYGQQSCDVEDWLNEVLELSRVTRHHDKRYPPKNHGLHLQQTINLHLYTCIYIHTYIYNNRYTYTFITSFFSPAKIGKFRVYIVNKGYYHLKNGEWEVEDGDTNKCDHKGYSWYFNGKY
ncbi:hypothetical protein L6452_23459 [Arctium lappa]|uniref:Uncharacterized protein n=1 Tax=Arctium lappa TaxID=4217 RepID=A0ACB9B2D6_ARCLA|nr:hypothetical protein L6452_23459 [Arctium lappa]